MPGKEKTDAPPVNAVFDTNILIDYLNGVDAARTEIERSAERLVSIITWMEVLAGARDKAEEDVIGQFLDECTCEDSDERVLMGALYESYQGWALKAGMKHPLTVKSLNRKLDVVIPDIAIPGIEPIVMNARPGVIGEHAAGAAILGSPFRLGFGQYIIVAEDMHARDRIDAALFSLGQNLRQLHKRLGCL